MRTHEGLWTYGTGAALLALVLLTRGDHFGMGLPLPDASAAVFFLAGRLLANRAWLGGGVALTALLDFRAVAAGGDAFCLSPAYAFLPLAYASLWLAGRLTRALWSPASGTPALLAGLTAGLVVADLLSSGSFYMLSGHFDPTWEEFARRTARYFPPTALSTALWVALGVAMQTLASLRLGSPAADDAVRDREGRS